MKQSPKDCSAREVAYQILYAVAEKDAYANLALKDAFNQSILSVQDRGFATELVYGTLRMQARLDFELNKLIQKGINSVNPKLLIILRMGLYQLEFMSVKPFAAVDETVRLAYWHFNKGAAGLCNAVLRNYLRMKDRGEDFIFPDKKKFPAQFLEAYYSYPRFMTGYMLKRWGMEATEKFCSFCNEVDDICILTNTLKTTPEKLKAELEVQGIEVIPGKYLPECFYLKGCGNPAELLQFKRGEFIVMEEGSALCAKALAPEKNSFVLDMCAAPGGKTMAMAMNMQGQGKIAAFDLYEHRIELIKENARRLKLNCISASAADSRSLGDEYIGKADYILLDAPCTGWGVLGRKADARFKKKYEEIAELASLSYELLCSAANYLREGGSMVYSTCTITAEENEKNIEKFLAEHQEFELEEVSSLLPYTKTEEEINDLKSGMWQILPQNQALEGFFLCRLKKKNSN